MVFRIAASVAFFLAVSSAQAATLVTSHDISGFGLRDIPGAVSTSPKTDTFLFSRFDPSLGTLTGVSFRMDGTVTDLETAYTNHTGSTFNLDYSAALTFSNIFSTDRTDGIISTPTSITLGLSDQSAPQSIAIAPNDTATVGPFSFSYDASQIINAAFLNRFIGNQDFSFLLIATLVEPASIVGRSSSGPGDPILTRNRAPGVTFDGTLSLTYEYTPSVVTTVPLPAALPLLAGGLSLLVIGAGRRRRKAA